MIVGVPCINRTDLLLRFLDSIDVDWPIVVIRNGPWVIATDEMPAFDIVTPPSNLGVAASWNFIIRTHPSEEWWCIANSDTELAPGDLDRLAIEMAKPGPRWVGMNGDWRVFGINRECVEIVGLFDENFHPIYCEDADYERRCSLAGVPWYFISGGARHEGSAAIRFGHGDDNARTYPQNVAYYNRKWGGHLRGGESFTSPFNAGGSWRDWTLDIARIREQAWR